MTAADRPPVTDNTRAETATTTVEDAQVLAALNAMHPRAAAPSLDYWGTKADEMRTALRAAASVATGARRAFPGLEWEQEQEQARQEGRAAGRAETTTGAIARGEALAAGDPDWMNVTRWPRTEAEATAVILRLIEDNRRMRHGSLCPECNAKAWGERADFRRERDELAAKVAAVEALADETEQAGDPLLRLDRLRAALTEQEPDR